MSNPTFAVLPAAGLGERLGYDTPKVLVDIQGRTMLERSLDALAESEVIDHCVIVISETMQKPVDDIIARNYSVWNPMTVSTVLGGEQRVDSVFAGLLSLEQHPDYSPNSLVAVHDAARCLVPPLLITEVVEAAGITGEGVIPVVDVADTIKIVDDKNTVISTPPRSSLRAVQTPQVFPVGTLIDVNKDYRAQDARQQDAAQITDDASLMEWAGHTVRCISGDLRALKITVPSDIAVAEYYLGAS